MEVPDFKSEVLFPALICTTRTLATKVSVLLQPANGTLCLYASVTFKKGFHLFPTG